MSETLREIIVPSLGESVTEATIARWLKKKGEAVKLDEPLIELETDKVTLEVNASSAGVLSDIKSAEGAKVSVGDVVGLIDTAATPSATISAATSATSEQASLTQAVETENSSGSESKTSSSREDGSSPAAKKIAAEKNLALAEVAGSGRDGRVTKGDVLSAVMDRQTSPGSPVGQSVGSGTRYEERVKMTRLRQRIAERLKEAQNTAAMLTTFNEVDMTRLIEMRATYKDAFEKKHGSRLGFMSFFIAAAVQALKELPSLNAEIQGEEIVYKNYYDIGVAVAAPQGLVVPVVRNADARSFAGIENEIVALGQKAKNGKLTLEDLSGATFTITNGGVFGSLMSTPILNPPQSGILGMHKVEKRPIVVNDQIVVRSMMYVALTYDHRIVDGREAVTFLVHIKDALENPERMLLNI
jgi:2-oxoglutarate dehydrogenase E2 component (dihydrolipoamide succinyltransferase)